VRSDIHKEKYIAHVDMDAFFAAIEQRDNPSYKGKPVIIGAEPKYGKGRGVVSTCSYEARKYGIHSAMPISIAYRKCPDAIFLPVNMPKYARVSRQIFHILENFTPEIEPVSIDEAFLDITGSAHLFGGPIATCRKVKTTIKKEIGLTASVGIAPNKMTAKIASDYIKPNGLVEVKQENLLDFLHPLPVDKLWGIGKKTKNELHKIGIKTIGDLARRNIEELIERFGENGRHAWKLARGIDPRKVEAVDIIKSISNEHTFEKDVNDENTIKDALMQLSESVSWRLRKSDLKGKTITLKIRFSDFKTYTRSVTLEKSTNFIDEIYKNSTERLGEFDLKKKAVRLVGVRVSNLSEKDWQTDLYEKLSDKEKKTERLHRALDRIIDKFGKSAIGHRDA
jgi:nucleotidyltransferase/DNA polymerase involved in DNA repair